MENTDQVINTSTEQESLEQESRKRFFSPKRIIFLVLGICGGIIVCYLLLVGILIISNDLMTNSSNCGRNALGIPKRCASQTPTQFSVPTQKPDNRLHTSTLLNLSLELPPEWTIDEKDSKVNKEILLKNKENTKSITVIKNYIGGVAGFQQYQPEKTVTLGGVIYKKQYFTEENQPTTISMFTNRTNINDKYLIIAKWNISDTLAEEEIDQILSTFKFTGKELSSDPSLPLDIKTCNVGEKRNLSYGLGSKTLEVKNKQNLNCLLTFRDEMEGEYTIYECIVPSEVKEVTISNLDIGKYCKEVKSGNFFLDNQR